MSTTDIHSYFERLSYQTLFEEIQPGVSCNMPAPSRPLRIRLRPVLDSLLSRPFEQRFLEQIEN
jgi:hypothetical protein